MQENQEIPQLPMENKSQEVESSKLNPILPRVNQDLSIPNLINQVATAAENTESIPMTIPMTAAETVPTTAAETVTTTAAESTSAETVPAETPVAESVAVESVMPTIDPTPVTTEIPTTMEESQNPDMTIDSQMDTTFEQGEGEEEEEEENEQDFKLKVFTS